MPGFFSNRMNSKKILLVEDDLFLRELYTDILSSEPWTLETAADGMEALAKIQTGGWDLILLDMNLPKLKGLEVVKKLREHSEKVTGKIIFLTNMEEGPELKEVESLGYQYLIKSQFSPDQFLQKVKELLV